ncbi:putative metallocarboxypeptidase ecm14 [Bienertia sinuspersici]
MNHISLLIINYLNFFCIGGDQFDVDAEICEIAELSIDEPDLERAILGVGSEDVDS